MKVVRQSLSHWRTDATGPGFAGDSTEPAAPCCQSIRVGCARPAGGGSLTESFRLGRPKPDLDSGLGLCLAARGGFTGKFLVGTRRAGPFTRRQTCGRGRGRSFR